MSSTTSIRLPEDLEEPLAALASKLDRSKSWVINQSIREYLARQALEEQRWRETDEALAAVERGEVVDGDAVHGWMRSWFADDEQTPPPIERKRG